MRSALHEELKCFGYYGFASGYSLSKYGPAGDFNKLYCDKCPLKNDCWERHKERARKFFPASTEIIDRLASKGLGSKELWEEYVKETEQTWEEGVFEPYQTIMGGNVIDGGNLASEVPFLDRGRVSLVLSLIHI